jgi:hypothetical protein
MNRLASRLRLLLGVMSLALGVGGTACYTPSVPLPPPLVENMQFALGTTTGTVTLTSPAEPQIGVARFSIFNESQNMGVIFVSNSDGSFSSPPFPGNEGDYIRVSYEKDDQTADRCTALHVGGTPVGSTCN